MDEYQPQGPYILQGGNYQKFSAEQFMFLDYGHLVKRREVLRKCQPSDLFNHLEWLLRQGENRQAKWLCQFCGRKKINRFLVLKKEDGFFLDSLNTCCNQESCAAALAGKDRSARKFFLLLCFSSILHFRNIADQDLVVNILRWAFEAPDPITKEWAFAFFAA